MCVCMRVDVPAEALYGQQALNLLCFLTSGIWAFPDSAPMSISRFTSTFLLPDFRRPFSMQALLRSRLVHKKRTEGRTCVRGFGVVWNGVV